MAFRLTKTSNLVIKIFIVFALIIVSFARKHKLKLHNEDRDMIDITTFGFFRNGMLAIDIHLSCDKTLIDSIRDHETRHEYTIGFTLDKSSSDGSASYMEDHEEPCVLDRGNENSNNVPDNDSVSVVFLRFNFTESRVHIVRAGKSLQQLSINPMPAKTNISMVNEQTCAIAKNEEANALNTRKRREPEIVHSPGKVQNLAEGADDPATSVKDIDDSQTAAKDDTNAKVSNADEEIGGTNKLDPKNANLESPTDEKKDQIENAQTPEHLQDGGSDPKTSIKYTQETGKDQKAESVPNSKENNDDVDATGDGAKQIELQVFPQSTDQLVKSEDGDEKGKGIGDKSDPSSFEHGLRNKLKLLNTTDGTRITYNVSFVVCISDKDEEGLYNLYFHHCRAHVAGNINLTVGIVEMNGKNYLSAGDVPLPPLFITMSMVFFTSAVYWMVYLRKNKEDVFKIHYLMLLLIYLKALSLLFHALDYHYIGIDGSPMEAFAILFYITYLTKGALLFIVIALVGSGWAFVKPILSDKDKKIFIVVIPLQVLANVAYIITDTSEEGESQYITWKAVFVLVDILCCGAILYPVIWSIRHLQDAATTDGKDILSCGAILCPVIWSIRHLQDAATTDGKVAISLAKLKLFRHFYVLVVCYIYFTRIIVYLLKVTVPFQYMWLDELFYEIATYIFFAITAYKFRPGSDNPYLLVPEEDESDIEMEVVTKTGLTESVVRVQSGNSTSAVQRELNHSA